jgi:hypothetical protein
MPVKIRDGDNLIYKQQGKEKKTTDTLDSIQFASI